MDSNMYSCGVFINLKKAVDTVNHYILLQTSFCKLEHYGIRKVSLSLFKNYLVDRKPYVPLNSVNSEIATNTCGVPQV